MLSREEEHALAVRWREHDDRAAGIRLVTSNLRLVVMIAREYQRAVHNLLDLVQEGNVGLLEAIKNFDPYRGVRFPSYAVWWVRAYIIRYIMNNWRMVKVGTTQAQRKLFFNLQKERDRLEREGFTAEPRLIAQRLGVKEKEVVEMEQRLAARDLSVNTPIDEGDDATLLDFLPGPAQTADDRRERGVSSPHSREGRRVQEDAHGEGPGDLRATSRGADARRGAGHVAGDRRRVRHHARAGPADRGAPQEATGRLSARADPRLKEIEFGS